MKPRLSTSTFIVIGCCLFIPGFLIFMNSDMVLAARERDGLATMGDPGSNAIKLCQDSIKASLTFPSSYSGGILSSKSELKNDGRVVVLQDFKAKNGIGNMVPQSAVCTILKGELISMNIVNR